MGNGCDKKCCANCVHCGMTGGDYCCAKDVFERGGALLDEISGAYQFGDTKCECWEGGEK